AIAVGFDNEDGSPSFFFGAHLILLGVGGNDAGPFATDLGPQPFPELGRVYLGGAPNNGQILPIQTDGGTRLLAGLYNDDCDTNQASEDLYLLDPLSVLADGGLGAAVDTLGEVSGLSCEQDQPTLTDADPSGSGALEVLMLALGGRPNAYAEWVQPLDGGGAN